jgi:RNA-directed DNA polymerase
MSGRLGPYHISTELNRIAEKARRTRGKALSTLAHHIDEHFLYEAYVRTRKDGAVGIDGKTAEDYEANLVENLKDLRERFKSGKYRAPAVRRVHIPKDEKTTRPVGIPTFEDKVLQRAETMVLSEVYEVEFYEFSFGFRPGRSQHQALDDLRSKLTKLHGGWVLEVDIQGYFENINHQRLREYLDLRVSDGVLRRTIDKWLKAGVMEDGVIHHPENGSPQGGVISPLLSNVYLHEVVDKWFVETVKPELNGKAEIVRYADDFVMVFEVKRDAERVWKGLEGRLGAAGLTLHPKKTRLVEFTKPRGAMKKPVENPKSFNFLGFTHYWGKSRSGTWVVKVKTAKDRLCRSLKKMAEKCRKIRHLPVREQHAQLSRAMKGHYNYYGVTCNGRAIKQYFRRVKLCWKNWLSRRSQRGYVSFEKFERMLVTYPLPPPCLPKSKFVKA